MHLGQVLVIKSPSWQARQASRLSEGFFSGSDNELLDAFIASNKRQPLLNSPSKASSASKTESEDTDYLEDILNVPSGSPRTKRATEMLLAEHKKRKKAVRSFSLLPIGSIDIF